MGVIIFFAIFALVILVSVRVGGWIDDKTGFVLGAIITGGLLIFYFHSAKHAGTIYSHQP